MWDKLLDAECRVFMKNMVRDNDTFEVIGEDDHVIDKFFKHVEASVKDYKILVVLTMQWLTFSDIKQTNLAIKYVGWEHASHFMMLMDYLSQKFIKGALTNEIQKGR